MSDSDEAQPQSPDMEPASIDVDREEGVTLRWADGHIAQFGLVALRVNCPCAGCAEHRRLGEAVWPRSAFPEALRILDARLVGAFGMAFDWSDGHSTGIYTWDTLRRWSSASGE
jgi:DUF971 family protein